MLEILAFSSLGLLIGFLVGLSQTVPFNGILILILSALGGGGVFYLKDATPEIRMRSSKLLLSLTLSIVVGLISGLLGAESQLFNHKTETQLDLEQNLLKSIKVNADSLTPLEAIEALDKYREYQDATSKVLDVFRSEVTDEMATIDNQYRQDLITADDAYEELRSLVTKVKSRGPDV
ncbi:MAG: hypothetical protein K0U98_16000 [Deltaproteobacteria bacterium]|nr:hypothetical protein [Deltaproteobacteria bacterium]